MFIGNKALIFDKFDKKTNPYGTLFYNEPDRKIFVRTEESALLKCTNSGIGVIILGFSSLGGNNLDQNKPFFEKILKKTNHKIPVIVCTDEKNTAIYRYALNSGVSGFIWKSAGPEKIEEQIQLILDNFKKWKPQSVDYRNIFYQKISKHLPGSIERFIEFRRNSPHLPTLIYGLPEAVQRFWLTHIFNEYYPASSRKIINLNAFDVKKNTNNSTWYVDCIELIVDAYAGIKQSEQFIVTGLDKAHSDLQYPISLLPDQLPGLIFLASDDLKKLMDVKGISIQLRGRLMANSFEMTPFSRLKGEEVEKMIDYLLSLPSVCPLNSPFLGQPAALVFEPETLRRLKAYKWEDHLEELRDALQYTIYEASIRNEACIGTACLPGRVNNISSKQEAKNYIDNIESELKANPNVYFHDEPKLKNKLKEFHIDYPDLFNNKDSRLLCEEFKLAPGFEKTIQVFIAYHPQSESFFERFKIQFKPLERKYPIQLTHSGQIFPGDDIKAKIESYIAKADIIFLNFCSDFIAENDFNDYIHPKTIQNTTARIIPVIVKPCAWDDIEPYGRLEPFPTDRTPLSLSQTAYLDKVLSEGMKTMIDPIIQRMRTTV